VKKTIERAVKVLEEKQLIGVTRKKSPTDARKNLPNIYELKPYKIVGQNVRHIVSQIAGEIEERRKEEEQKEEKKHVPFVPSDGFAFDYDDITPESIAEYERRRSVRGNVM
jgi:hypothetical protein